MVAFFASIIAIVSILITRYVMIEKNKEKFYEWKINEFEQWKTKYTFELNQKTVKQLESLFSEKKQSYPWMAQQYADFLYTFDLMIAHDMCTKSHPDELV